MMNEAVFISDLHLHPQNSDIHQRFENFLNWAKKNTKSVYILGDFIHAWAGDDLIDPYGLKIIKLLRQLHASGLQTYFMPGNRDFLIGKQFLEQAQANLLQDPCIINLNGERLYLTHGDRYCSQDKAHQFLRLLTRNRLFISLFLVLPKQFRKRLVDSVRVHSQNKKRPSPDLYRIDERKLFKDMHRYKVFNAIYGHIHQQGHYQDIYKFFAYQRYVLSDWDDNPGVLCYNIQRGLYFTCLEF
jgi:UDP-2,3-diacylglucosamine hydrolase